MARKLMAHKDEMVQASPADNPQQEKVREVLVPAELAILERVSTLEQEIIKLQGIVYDGFVRCGVDFNSPEETAN